MVLSFYVLHSQTRRHMINIFTVLSDSITGYHGPKSGAPNSMTSSKERDSLVLILCGHHLYILTRMGKFLLFIKVAFSVLF